MTIPAAPAPPAPPAPAPAPGSTFLTVIVPISGVVAAIAAIVITYQISRISDLATDIRNVNGRIDQIYTLNSQSTADLGFIKGSLEATAEKITAAAEKNEALTKRIETLIASEDATTKNIQDIGSSIIKLSTTVNSQQSHLEEISDKINSLNPLIHKNNFWSDTTIFSPKELTNSIELSAPNANVIPFDWDNKTAVSDFIKLLSESGVGFGKFAVFTKDPAVGSMVKTILTKEGSLPQK